ncbi:MAG: hypothetical protein HOP33_10090 [Verrucomicrobia bacterium]|nr:hypothetical protein [Verrucomicrobiota bacterium]
MISQNVAGFGAAEVSLAQMFGNWLKLFKRGVTIAGWNWRAVLLEFTL